MNKDSRLKKILFFVCVFFCLVFAMTVFYIKRNFVFSGNPLAQILFHVIVQIDGANPDFIKGIVIQCIIIPIIGAVVSYLFLYSNISLFKKLQETKLFIFLRKFGLLIACICMLCTLFLCTNTLGLKEYIEKYTESSTLYEDEYVDPSLVKYEFPEKKRNLIYILLESMETSDYSIEQGGAFEDCYIPELYEIAKENITFNELGFKVPPNCGWTIAAMIAESSGVPLDIPLVKNDFVTSNKFMPGVYSLGDLLEDNGYHNELLIGSEAVFGGRLYYYQKHGNYTIHDYNWAVEQGLVDPSEFVWWGFEDYKLFEFAKNDLLELSKQDEPFNLTMLTVDTHHDDGYVCEYCKNDYDQQLGNVYACSSRHVAEFIDWCKKQDFYENTTIVIAGDHTSMDVNFGQLLSNFDRSVYYTIINPSEELVPTTNREICTFDVYPTTVASLGIKFNNDRLGLGTNLFTNTETLMEKYGKSTFFHLVQKNSNYYIKHILYGF